MKESIQIDKSICSLRLWRGMVLLRRRDKGYAQQHFFFSNVRRSRDHETTFVVTIITTTDGDEGEVKIVVQGKASKISSSRRIMF